MKTLSERAAKKAWARYRETAYCFDRLVAWMARGPVVERAKSDLATYNRIAVRAGLPVVVEPRWAEVKP